MKLLIASDHAGFELKTRLIELHPELSFIDLGPKNLDRVDYPEYAKKCAQEIQKDPNALAVLICGTGIGVAIAANKFKGIRAATVENPVSARLTREHNHCNVLCLGARLLAPEYASEILKAFLEARPSTEGRHEARVNMISQYEKDN